LSDGEMQHFAYGSADFAGEGFETIEAAREAWRIHGREVFEELTAAYPKGVLWAVKQFGAPLTSANRKRRRCAVIPAR
jgi:hypothetical protein